MRGPALVAAALSVATASFAHEIRPGYLELRESTAGSYELLWKRPAGGEVEIRIAPVIPEGCRLFGPDRQQITPGSVLVRGTLQCEGGVAGKTLRIAGLETTATDVLVRIHHADGRLESHLLRPASPAATLGALTTTGQRAVAYLRLGVEHILLGVDHLLFVLGLLLI
ncbi:MAG TPA: HupE/UreJ family protein, partial [Vicinamibacteria bacterium]|nr:HupE/UreJ family protein [Vicinamibacteria bacterium]